MQLIAGRVAKLMFMLAGIPILTTTGCTRPQQMPIQHLEQGLVWMFPGVEGGEVSLRPACHAFRSAGVKAGFRIHDWNKPLGIIRNLVALDENRAWASRIAEHIVFYRQCYPDAPIDLLGYSGGGGMAVMVAEALPTDVRLRNVILVQPALSPEYDLRPALQRIDGKLVNFYSPHDWFLLGAGTYVFGTMDRVHSMSAGKTGFRLVASENDVHLIEHVEQREWTTDMLTTGHIGTHMGILFYGWNKEYVAPFLLPPTPHEETDRASQ